MQITTYNSLQEWQAAGKQLFGSFEKFRFVCPVCKNEATVEDFEKLKDKGATPNSATCECIGRYTGTGREAFGEVKEGKPCNYAGYGLFRLSPVRVKMENGNETHCFAFAEPAA